MSYIGVAVGWDYCVIYCCFVKTGSIHWRKHPTLLKSLLVTAACPISWKLSSRTCAHAHPGDWPKVKTDRPWNHWPVRICPLKIKTII
ncbi:unnamed protein product [Discosporangium mesarthrocarpum]